MSNPGDADDTPLTSVRQMAEYFAAGCKPREQFRIGTEHEKFGFRRADLSPTALSPGGRPTGQHPRCAGRFDPIWRHPDPGRREHDRAEAGRGLGLA